MNTILLSGGSGKRLWPLSNDIRSKQFIRIFKKEDGSYESMIQRMYRQIKDIDKDAIIAIATSKLQVSVLKNQLGANIDISVEPYRRDTFPAIALATAYLHDIKSISEEEAVVVCPIDPLVDNTYFDAIFSLWKLAQSTESNLFLMGIEPSYPSEKFGYIIPVSDSTVCRVSSFKEKPNKEIALSYIKQGALWNGGIFAFKLGYVLNIAKEKWGISDYESLYQNYESLPKISFDYAVVEKEKNISVMRFNGPWQDIGTWDVLCEKIETQDVGSNVISDKCQNTFIISELDIPIICLGLTDTVVSVGYDGILVSKKELSSNIKPLVDSIDQRIRFAEKSWGDFRVLDSTPNSMTIKLNIKPKHRLSYHYHKFRDEVWTILSGTGSVVIDGEAHSVKPGDIINIEKKCRHSILSDDNNLEVLEVQIGTNISVFDKYKNECIQ